MEDLSTIHREVGEAIDKAAELLPDGWEVHIEIEPGSATVRLFVDGDEVIVPEGEPDLREQIYDAIDHAKHGFETHPKTSDV